MLKKFICCKLFSEIKLLLTYLLTYNTLDFTAGIFEKKSFKKLNCGRWSENFDVTLTDSVSSKEVALEKILSINVEVSEILVGRTM